MRTTTSPEKNLKAMKILRGDKNRLDKYKFHGRQAYWEVVKLILDGEIKIDKNIVYENPQETIQDVK